MVFEVSGPSEQSKRTDLGVLKQSTQPVRAYTGGTYGSNKNTKNQQNSAKLMGNPFKTPNQQSLVGNPFADLVELGAKSSRPYEPITSGINFGDGPGTEVMRGMPNQTPSLIDTIKYLTQFDPSGDAELIYNQLLNNES